MPNRRLGFILPAGWWRIPLAYEDTRKQAVQRIVDYRFPKSDDSAQLRHDFHTQLTRLTDQSAGLGGVLMCFYFMEHNNYPFTAAMTCFDVGVLLPVPEQVDAVRLLAHWVGDTELEESRPEIELEPGVVPDQLPEIPVPDAAPIPDNEDASAEDSPYAGVEWTKVTGYDVTAYRRDITGTSPEAAEFGGDEVSQLRVSYISFVPGFGLVQTAFSTPFPQAREAWVMMFDAVIASFRSVGTDDDDNQEEVAQ